MKRVFGGGNQTDDNGASARPPSSYRHDEEDDAPDEATRLLPNRINSDRHEGYLSPDDPAVSPYNLFTVRFARYLTIFFTFITFLWWILLLISIFITPPGLSTRGSGFYGFGFASVAFATLLVQLLFFSAPSRSARIFGIIMAVLLLADTIMILAVPKLRADEAWTGVASVAWALLMSLWAVIADRTVKWGKAEEEERLTGRQEDRRTLLEWVEVLLSTIFLAVLAVVAALVTCTLIQRALDARMTPPGTMFWVDGDKYQIHLHCSGNVTDAKGKALPTVLFEGGEDPVEYGLWRFAENAIANGSFSRYCFADRPGMAWSDTAPSPFSASQATEALSEALARAGEEGPWVLVSAGIGSIYSRVFSSRHGEAVKGLVMIDPLHEDLLNRIGRPGRGFMLWLRGIISPLGLDRLPAALFKGRNAADRIWGVVSYQSGRNIFAKLQESLVAESLTKRDVTSSRAIQNRDVPVVVISSGVMMKKDRQWEDKQRDLTQLTDDLHDWDVVTKAPHQVWRTLDGREIIERRIKQLVHGK